MKILFVYSDLCPSHPGWTGHFYIGLASLSAVLKAEGHETSLIHIIQEFSKEEDFIEQVKARAPELIAFSSTTLTFKYVQRMAGWLYKAGLKVPVISGGIHSTLQPLEVVGTEGIDMACVGEGEIALKNLAHALEKGQDFRGIQGIWVNDRGVIYKNGASPLIRNLDDLPFPDRSLFDYPNLEHEMNGEGVFMASRGCPYLCTYCSNHVLKEMLSGDRPGDYVRFRSIDSVISEIRQTLSDYPFVKSLHFDDDLFFLKRKWAEEFTEKYRELVGLPFTCNMRPNHMNDQIALLLKRAGCTKVKIGLESGNERIRNEVLKRHLSDQQMYRSFEACHHAGIKVHTFNMLGLPFETGSTVLDTIKMNARGKADLMQVSIFFPFPKTALYDVCQEMGAVVDETGYDYFIPMLTQETISRRQVFYFHKNFRIITALFSRIYSWGGVMSRVAEKIADTLLESGFLIIAGRFLDILRAARNFVRK